LPRNPAKFPFLLTTSPLNKSARLSRSCFGLVDLKKRVEQPMH
jgi:hypothetical protein